jgi:3-oxoadipate enol-lactonase
MAFLENDGFRVHYELSGPANAPAVVFSNSLGTNLSLWEPQLAALEKSFRVLRYDTRGHGQTSATPGPYTMGQLAGDVVHLLDALHIERAHFCGISMGGLIGMWLGVHAPSRLARLALCSTGAKIGGPEVWNPRIESIRARGMKPMAAVVLERWLTPEFRAHAPQAAAAALRMLEESPPDGYVACCEAIRDADLREAVAAIRAPTLVIMGAKDPATPPALGQALAASIPGARYVELEGSHITNVEAAEAFNAALSSFLRDSG